MLSIFGHSKNRHIVFLWANYIGYKRRTLGQWIWGQSGVLLGTPISKNKNKNPIAVLWLNQ